MWGNKKAIENNVTTVSEHIRILSDIRDDVLGATKGF